MRGKGLIALAMMFVALAGCDAFMSTERRIERAQEAVAEGDFRSASIDLSKVLQEEGNNLPARLLMASVAMKLGDPLGAQTELAKARELGASPESTAALEADVLLALGKFEELAKALEAGTLKLPEPTRSLALGRAYNGLTQYTRAAESFNRALKAAPESAMAKAGLAEALGGSGDVSRALTLVQEVTKQQPDFAYGWLVQGSLQARAARFDEAAEALRKAAQFASTQLDARQITALLALTVETNLAKGDYATAEQAQTQLMRTGLNPPLASLLGGRVLMAQRNYRSAIQHLQPLVADHEKFAPARFLLGAALLADNRLEQAEYHLGRLVQDHPEHIEARKLLAQARLRLERGSAAMEALVPAMEDDEKDATLAGLAAAANLQAGNTGAAIEVLSKAVDQRPGVPEPYLQLARALLVDRKFERAIGVLQQMPESMRANPQRAALLVAAVSAKDGWSAADRTMDVLLSDSDQNVAILKVATEYYARRGEYLRAKSYATQVLQKQPADIDAQLQLARLEELAGNTDAARALFERVIERDPQNVRAPLAVARMATLGGDAARAVRVLEQSLARIPNERSLQLALVQAYHAASQSSKADALASNMLRSDPNDGDLNFSLGQLYSDLAAYDQALARFSAAASAAPENVEYQFGVARTQLALGRPEGARVLLMQILQRRPDWTPALATVALMDIQNGNAAAALDRAKSHVARSPKDPGALVLLGDVQMALQRYSEAAESFARAAAFRDSAVVAVKEARARQLASLDPIEAPLLRWLGKQPGDLMAHQALADTYASTGRSTRAIAEYELVVSQKPRDAMALNNLAWLYFESGDARAKDVAERAYRLAPRVAAIADTYGWILVQQGKAGEAVEILRKADIGSGGQFEIAYHYAVALAKSGQTAAARQRLNELLKSKYGPVRERSAAEQLLAALNAH